MASGACGAVGLQFRPGLAIAYQMMTVEAGSTDVDDIEGLGLAFLGELAVPVSPQVNALAHVSFISQPVGGNSDRDVTFAPMPDLAVGIEYDR